jgi:hypothetical protein
MSLARAVFRPSRSSAASRRRWWADRAPWVFEAADLPVGRGAVAWRSAGSLGRCDVVGSCRFPAEQELGRFEEEVVG